MKFWIAFLVSLLLVSTYGCSDNAAGTSGDPFGGGGGGGGGVTFTIASQQGQQGIIFTGTPSVAVTITQVTASLPAQQFQDVIPGDGTTVFPAGQPAQIGEYTGNVTGQWTFRFQGKIGSATGTAFDVTSNFTVQ